MADRTRHGRLVFLGLFAKRERYARAHRAAEGTGRFGFVQPRPQPDVRGNRFDSDRSFPAVRLLESVNLRGSCRDRVSLVRHVV